LIETRKSPEFTVTAVALDALVELVGRNVIDQLREDDAANMHASFSGLSLLKENHAKIVNGS
jgi:hypothetical protein